MLYDEFVKIFAHRGLWQDHADQNSIRAIEAAFALGLSVEIDLWKKDETGQIWVGHDIGIAKTNLEDILKSWVKFENVSLALNIKCDGMLSSLILLFEKYAKTKKLDYFAFDMSMPEQYIYLKNGFPIAHRLSEFESNKTIVEGRIYWLDSFESDWYLSLESDSLAALLKSSIVVSPELHRRSSSEVHRIVRQFETLGICLDNVEEFNDII